MSAFLISKRNSEQIDTPVFADADANEELVLVFTDPSRADDFIRQSNTINHQVIELDDISFMEWLIQCHRTGVKSMVTDPTWPEMNAGLKLNSLEIAAHLQQAGQHVVLTANSDF